MTWHVAPLGLVTTGEGKACALCAFDDQRVVELVLGTSWGAAAEQLISRIGERAVVTVDPAFHRTVQDVALIRGWTPKASTPELDMLRATVGFMVAHEVPPELHGLVNSLIESWTVFFKSRLWEAVDPELMLVVRAPHVPNAALCVLGRSGIEFGIALYDDVSMADAIWAGEAVEVSGASLLSSDDADEMPAMAFEPLGIPPPLPIRVLATRAVPPREFELRLLDAALRLLLGLEQDVLEIVPAPAPKKKRKTKKKPAVKKKKKPAVKKTKKSRK